MKHRAGMVTTIRTLLKSLGVKLPAGWSTECFAGKCRRHLAETAELPLIESLLVMIETFNAQIKQIDRGVF